MSNIPTPFWTSPDGRHVIYCGDCREFLPHLTGVDSVVTDPPFDLVAKGGGIGAKRKYLADIAGHLDCGFDISMLSSFQRWMAFCAKATLVRLIQQAESQALRWQILTWNKTNPTPLSNGNYLPDTEYIIHAFDKLPECTFPNKSRWISGPVEKNQIEHPTVKPIYVMLKLLATAAGKGATILDPFMGSGTTGVACIRTGRRFIGVEIEPKYCQIAVERMELELAQPMLPTMEPQAQMKQQELA